MEAPEAPPNIPPLPHVDSLPQEWSFFNETAHLMAAAIDGQNAGQNHDRSLDMDILPPPPAQPQPQAVDPETAQAAMPPPAVSGQPENTEEDTNHERDDESDGGSGSDHDDSEAEDEQQARYNRWQPIEEDKSVPHEDELTYIARKGEHSALDHEYWEKKIFFDLDDPEIFPVASGRIDWLVEQFNGTQENPNKELIMRSPIVRIGDYDWRIKFYPKGNQSDYLSVYVECVTMQSEDFDESHAFSPLPLPFLNTQDKLKQRTSAAVQLGVVMYNPAEPRTYNYQYDAHQFTKRDSDYGWTRFTHFPRREFTFRSHGQRQALLRDDKLAFSAFVRIIHDPTKCMWSHGSDVYNDSLAMTSLRPFWASSPMFAAVLPLLHFAPFRELIYKYKNTKMVFWLQGLLWKIMSRTRSQQYGIPGRPVQCDEMAWLRHISRELMSETDAKAVADLIGTFSPEQGAAVGKNRLRTKGQASLQSAINAHATTIATAPLIALQLERDEFDRKERKWSKLTNYVELENGISVGGVPYILYAFSTHCCDLTSNKFNVYVRPSGARGLWYAYTPGKVVALTHKQAVDTHFGFRDINSPLKESRRSSHRHRRQFRFDELNEVAHVVFYVRHDYESSLTDQKDAETWEVPDSVLAGKPPKEVSTSPEPEQQDSKPASLDAEQHREIDDAIKPVNQDRVDDLSGAATPCGYAMDGEDIVMSDAQPISTSTEKKALSDAAVKEDCVIEHLGREYYKGQLAEGLYQGAGHLIAMNGDEYIGAFSRGEKSGYGKMVYAHSGNTYEGEWLENKHHGQGKLTEAKTGNVFEGGWKNGKKSGEFVLKGTVTDEDKGCCSICYDKEINTAFYDCGHVLACRECANRIDTCPICRRRVVARLELFGVKMIFE